MHAVLVGAVKAALLGWRRGMCGQGAVIMEGARRKEERSGIHFPYLWTWCRETLVVPNKQFIYLNLIPFYSITRRVIPIKAAQQGFLYKPPNTASYVICYNQPELWSPVKNKLPLWQLARFIPAERQSRRTGRGNALKCKTVNISTMYVSIHQAVWAIK